ncbi:MAG: hypothetical protein ACKOXO_05145 [Cyanobium sp.]
MPAGVCEALEAALAQGPRSLAELAEAIDQPPVEVLRLAALMLHQERLGLERGEAGAQARAGCERVNARLLQRMAEGWPYGSLAAPAVGSGVSCDLIEALCCLAPGSGPVGSGDESWLRQRLEDLGIRPAAAGGSDVKPDYALDEQTLKTANTFQRERLPALRDLGVFTARFQPRSPGHGLPS